MSRYFKGYQSQYVCYSGTKLLFFHDLTKFLCINFLKICINAKKSVPLWPNLERIWDFFLLHKVLLLT